jgi:hypothetical protein
MSHAIALAPSGKSQAHSRASRGLEEGRFAIVTNVGGGMRWTRPRVRRSSRSRMAKSCGPGAPMQALRSLVSMSPTTDGGNQAWSPGRSRISRKTIAQGRPDDVAEPVVTAACVFVCRRAMGAASTRPSLRPLDFRGRCLPQLGRETRCENAGVHAQCCLIFEITNQLLHRRPVIPGARRANYGAQLRT